MSPRGDRRLGRRALRRGSALPAGARARADRHAARRQRAARGAHRRAAARLRLRAPSCTRCPWTRCSATGMRSIINVIVRRRHGAGKTIALNAHGDVVPPGEGWTHDPYGGVITGGKLYGRAAAVSKSDFATYHLRAARARVARRPARRLRRAALHLRRGVRRRARPRLAAAPGADAVPTSCSPPASATRSSPPTTVACRSR